MAVKQREYLLTVDEFNRPGVVEGTEAIGVLLMRLILLNPGSDPLHPLMGVGIENYRYALNRLDELQQRILDQINVYLPEFTDVEIEMKPIEENKTCNIEITIENTVFIYDSSVAPIPITLTDIKSN